MSLACVNDGGDASLLRFDVVIRDGQELELTGSAAATLSAWQLRPGEAVTVVDRQDVCWRARLDTSPIHGQRLVAYEHLSQSVESPVRISVYQALPEKERFELILQKLTELGAWRLVPLETERSTTREQRDAGQKKSHRWPVVLRRAARQCRRAVIPELTEVADWESALADAAACELKIMLSDRSAAWMMHELLNGQKPTSLALFIGPEGGFTETEIVRAHDLGVVPARLGPRVLRTETAAIAALTAAQLAVGDLGRD